MPLSPALNRSIRDPRSGKMYPSYQAMMRDYYTQGLGGGGGGGGFPSYQEMYAQSLNRLFDQARKANEDRYQEILAGFEGLGEAEAGEIRRQFTGLESQAMSDLVSRGVSGTTVRPTVQSGIQRDMMSAIAQSRERWMLEKLRFMERRTDEYPDLRMYLGMMQNYGRYGGGSYKIPQRR